MTSEAGSRSLAARLAPSKTHDRESDAPTGAAARPRKSRSTAAWKLDVKGVKASNGSGKHADDRRGASDANGASDRRGASDAKGISDRRGASDAKGISDRRGISDAKGISGTPVTSDRDRSHRRLEPVRAALPTTPTRLVHDDPLDVLLNEAQAAVSDGANTLRDVRERYRTAYLEQVDRWERLRTQTGPSAGAGTGAQASSQTVGQEAMAGREVNQERSTLGRIDLAVKS
ncbi:MAG TPA: hypothetical protein VL749_07050, partial [Patescibacteria group bacterium]|nr:hypothetical protein [Patescibacteria group bacterium]